MKKSVKNNSSAATQARRPQDWRAEEQLAALIASDGDGWLPACNWLRQR
jgi:hypothetical protein